MWRALVILASGAALLATASCSGSDCGDGTDNDADGFIDGEDPGCIAGDSESPDPNLSACSDGVDNDGDGALDIDDFGCDSDDDDDEYNQPVPQCRDGIDNDSDGKLDFPNDPGCMVSPDDDEEDGCPNASTCPACANGDDDDTDDVSDYPDDLGCDSAADMDEFNADPSICGANVSLQPLPTDGVVSGFVATDDSNELISFDCGGSGGESVYQIQLDSAVALSATTVFDETAFDTVVYLRSDCRDQDTEIACNDDVGEDDSSTLSVPRLEPGKYFLVVDAHNNGTGGAFKLVVDRYLAQGEPCDPADPTMECPPGLICRLAMMAAANETCEIAACGDGDDFDGDGRDDYPDDPGCTDAADNDESDDCPGGGGCPNCGDGVDNTDPEDALADFPDDPGCSSASDTTEVDCSDPDLVVINDNAISGNTSSAIHNSSPTCGSAGTAKDIAHQLVVPGQLVSLTINTNMSAFDTTLYVKKGDCAAANMACDDDSGLPGTQSALTLSNVVPDTYYIIVDGYGSAGGNYNLNVTGVIATGQACNQAQITAGIFTCQNGGACTTGTCQ